MLIFLLVEKVDDVPYLPGVAYDPYPRVMSWLRARSYSVLLEVAQEAARGRAGVYFRLPLDSYESILTVGTEREAYTFCLLVPSDRRHAELYARTCLEKKK